MEKAIKNKKTARLKRVISKRTILFLILTLIANTYAWFIYVTEVSNNMTAHVKAWEFRLQDGEQTGEFNFVANALYPGMTDCTQTISTQNLGEFSAELSLEINYMKILGTEYRATDPDMSSAELLRMTQEDFPFDIVFYIDGEVTTTALIAPDEQTTITITVSWNYESQNDELDTSWGNLAYSYNQAHPDSPSIEIVVKIKAVQSSSSS